MARSTQRGTLTEGDIARMLGEAIDHQRARIAERGKRAGQEPANYRRYGDIEANTVPEDDEPVMHTDLPYGGSLDWVGTLTARALKEPGTGVDASTLHRCLETHRREQEAAAVSMRDLPSELDPHDLAQAGWGVITPAHRREDYLDALAPLLRHREDAAGELFFDDVVYSGQSVDDFLFDLDLAPGVIDPKKLPYYLLIVGGPDEIPYALQYALSINRAVGRVAFDDLAGYQRYAASVVAAETEGTSRPRGATILSVENGDYATSLLARHLVDPLLERLTEYLDDYPGGGLADDNWRIQALRGVEADKAAFARTLTGADVPALALVSCHGLGLALDNPHQRAFQGALACQTSKDSPLDQHLFHAHDVPCHDDITASPLHGLIVLCFACYGAGTPREDDYPQESMDNATGETVTADAGEPFTVRELTPSPFVAAWPQAMLEEGALAVVGHVDRGWTLSFAWTLGHQTTEAGRSLEDAVKQLIHGHRLGHAIRSLHRRYTAIAAHLAAPLDALRRGEPINRRRLATTWTAHHDARNFVILGDPAVYAGGQPSPASYGFNPNAMRTGSADASGLTLPPDVYLHAVREARRTGDTLEAWLAALVRAHRDPIQQ